MTPLVKEMLEVLHEPDMTEDEKDKFNARMLENIPMTMDEMEKELQQGIDDGLTIREQVVQSILGTGVEEILKSIVNNESN